MTPGKVGELLAGTVFGPVRFVAGTTSTNADLLGEARAGAPEGRVLVADHQTAGRGRRGRSWVAPAGSALLASVLLRPRAGSAALTLLSPAVGLAVRDACADAGADVQLKWPNDVIASVPGEPGEAKLAGVLAEADVPSGGTAAVVAGFGVNLVSQPALSAMVAAQAGEAERDFTPLPPTALDALAVAPPRNATSCSSRCWCVSTPGTGACKNRPAGGLCWTSCAATARRSAGGCACSPPPGPSPAWPRTSQRTGNSSWRPRAVLSGSPPATATTCDPPAPDRPRRPRSPPSAGRPLSGGAAPGTGSTKQRPQTSAFSMPWGSSDYAPLEPARGEPGGWP